MNQNDDDDKIKFTIIGLQRKRTQKNAKYRDLLVKSKKLHDEIVGIDHIIDHLHKSAGLKDTSRKYTVRSLDREIEILEEAQTLKSSQETQTIQPTDFFQHITTSLNKIQEALVRMFFLDFFPQLVHFQMFLNQRVHQLEARNKNTS